MRDRTVARPSAPKLRATSFDSFVRDVDVGRVRPPPAVRETSFAYFLRARDAPEAPPPASVQASEQAEAVVAGGARHSSSPHARR